MSSTMETSSRLTATDENDAPKAGISITQMFDRYRVNSITDMFLLFLYFPIGICLFTIRLFIFLHILLVSNLLPKDSHLRSVVFRSIFFVLGVIIQEDNLQLKNFKAQLIISNRVSDFDPLVINLIYPCEFFSSSSFPRYITWLFGISKEAIAQNKNDVPTTIKSSPVPVLCFPESSRTNGRVGLFKFEEWPFSCNLTSHLVFVESKNPLLNVNISPLGASWFANLFWLLFLPVTIFNIRYLSSIEKKENESAESLAKRAQLEMALLTKREATNFDKNDKKEMVKRYQSEQLAKNTAKHKGNSSHTRPFALSVDKMAMKVKEVLPQVPLSAIKSDIEITQNIDDTIERILSGSVQYQPEASTSSGGGGSNGESIANPAGTCSELFYCGATNFGKSASERSNSFQERKQHLFRVARLRYIQKQNLLNNK